MAILVPLCTGSDITSPLDPVKKLALTFAYTLHSCLYAGHFADNHASARVLAKLGFEPTGAVSTRSCLARGSVENCIDHVRRAFAPPRAGTTGEAGYDREDAMAA